MICDMCIHKFVDHVENQKMVINGVELDCLNIKVEVCVCCIGQKPRKIAGDMYVCRHHEYEWR